MFDIVYPPRLRDGGTPIMDVLHTVVVVFLAPFVKHRLWACVRTEVCDEAVVSSLEACTMEKDEKYLLVHQTQMLGQVGWVPDHAVVWQKEDATRTGTRRKMHELLMHRVPSAFVQTYEDALQVS